MSIGKRQSQMKTPRWLFSAVCVFILLGWMAFAYDNPQTPQSGASQPSQADSGVVTFHVTTREVILDLIALNGRNGHVPDLADTELQVPIPRAPTRPRSITTELRSHGSRPLLASTSSTQMRRSRRLRARQLDSKLLPVVYSVRRSTTRSRFDPASTAGPAASMKFLSLRPGAAFASSIATAILWARPLLRRNHP